SGADATKVLEAESMWSHFDGSPFNAELQPQKVGHMEEQGLDPRTSVAGDGGEDLPRIEAYVVPLAQVMKDTLGDRVIRWS
ncbi:MAG: hypothetical protein ACKPKO_00735, partial [Candidatus Fonsibacter sp.]